MQSQWNTRQRILEQQSQLIKSEHAELQRLLSEKGTATNEAQAEREKLLAQQSVLEAQQTSVQGSVQQAKSQIMAMNTQLPPVLQASWQEHINYLTTENPSPSEMLNHIAEALKKLHAFNQRVVLHQTVMTVSTPLSNQTTEKKIQVKQIYLGASKAWYISADSRYWGTGQPSPEGWQWQPLEQQAPALAHTLNNLIISIEQPSKAQWISLPYSLVDTDVSAQGGTQ